MIRFNLTLFRRAIGGDEGIYNAYNEMMWNFELNRHLENEYNIWKTLHLNYGPSFNKFLKQWNSVAPWSITYIHYVILTYVWRQDSWWHAYGTIFHGLFPTPDHCPWNEPQTRTGNFCRNSGALCDGYSEAIPENRGRDRCMQKGVTRIIKENY